MGRIRSMAGALGAAIVLVVPAVTAGASSSTGGAATGDAGAEYVVGYAAGAHDEAMAAIAAAGGTVVEVNDTAGLALVETDAAGFLAEVRQSSAVTGAASNHSIGTSRLGMPHRFAEERPAEATDGSSAASKGIALRPARGGVATDDLSSLQWDMAAIGATPSGAWRRATGRGVTVGVIDTGVDASHPDIAPNFSHELSVNFVTDIPDVDGPCEYEGCVDPADVDDGGHGTHVAGTIAGARNGIGITGVAPDATIVNVRAGQDSGYFFLFETVNALTYAAGAQLDVVNMSFYTDPWLFNCESADDYVSGTPTEEEIAEQAFIRSQLLAALDRAHDAGVTLVAAAGNSHTDFSLPTRPDATSPDYPPGTAAARVVTNNCLDLPTEGPDVISVSATGPSGTKADYSDYGLGHVEVSAPGGWFRDFIGTPQNRTPSNLILSSYPLHVAIEEGLADADGHPTDDFSAESCVGGSCGFYTYLQGTSMASPHAAGVAALIVEAHGRGNPVVGYSLDPDTVRQVLLSTATDHACPAGGTEIYTDEGRPASWNAVCDGTTALNGLYGEGIVDAVAAVRR